MTKGAKLLNQTAFAKACGVSPTTIRNRVERGDIVPAQTVGDRFYFTESQVVSMQLSSLRGSVTQSFLGLIFEDDDAAYKILENTFVSHVKSLCPSAHAIISLMDSMKSMDSNAEFKLTESTTIVFRSMVIDKFLLAVRGMVNDYISSLYFEEPLSRTFSYQFFLDVICEDESHKPDASLVSTYESCGIKSMKYVLATIRSNVSTKFEALKSKFGIYNCCCACSFTLRDALYTDGKVLLNNEVPIIHDSNAPNSKAIYDAIEKDAKSKLVSNGIGAIYRDGFYTTIRVSSSISDNELADIISLVTSGDYKSIYISSREKAPKLLLSIIDSRVESNSVSLLG